MTVAAQLEHLATGSLTKKRAQLAGFIPPLIRILARGDPIPSNVWEHIQIQRLHSPRRAHALARVVLALAKRVRGPVRAVQVARAQLTLLETLNTLGEYRAALALCSDTVARFEKLQDVESIAYVQLEAAWAETYLGHLEQAQEYLHATRKLALAPSARHKVKLRLICLRARILREKGHYIAALRLFEAAYRGFLQRGDTINAMRLQRELAHTYTRTDPSRALPLLAQVRRFFVRARVPLEVAWADYYLAQAYHNLNRFERALRLLARARRKFLAHGASFFAALAALDAGFAEWRLTRFTRALARLRRARAQFLALGAASEVSTCDINIAGILLERYRFDEALPLLESARAQALREGRRIKAAVCLWSIAWAYNKQGRYAQALDYYLRARAEFEQAHLTDRLVSIDLELGETYLNLGEVRQALSIFERAGRLARRVGLMSALAWSELQRAQALIALNRTERARAVLIQAHALFLRNGQPLYAALCDRLLAQIGWQDRKIALRRLSASRRCFSRNEQSVEVALCELVEGELHARWKEWTAAQQHLTRALALLGSGFPDYRWRAEFGLAQVAAAQGDASRALTHYLEAVAWIARVRGGLALEGWSNTFFASRHHVFTRALECAVSQRRAADALRVIEAAKAQIFLQRLARRDWSTPVGAPRDTRRLAAREAALRHELAKRSAAFTLCRPLEANPPSETSRRREAEQARRSFDTLTHEYEQVVAQLRLTRTGLAGVPELASFSLDAFRAMAQRRWGVDWAALDYYLADAQLYIAYIDPHRVEMYTVRWTHWDQMALEQCTSTHPDLRELVYDGALHGHVAPRLGPAPLEHLAERLIPPPLRLAPPAARLLVSAHGLLHRLPFHALALDGTPLLERHSVIHVPNLQAWVELNRRPPRGESQTGMLLCGMQDFQAHAPALHHTRCELAAIARHAGGTLTRLWQQEATRANILALDRRGALAQQGIIHFATHAIIEPEAPHWSRILLADQDLTVLDITNLKLNARLVVLSACSSAVGQGGAGDEWLTLAHAFFYAGARAVVASLWPVADESTARLMSAFYANLKTTSIAEALRRAQLKLGAAGVPPSHWAGFVAIGEA